MDTVGHSEPHSATHVMFDGRLQVYKRGNSKFWQMAARVGGARFRESTKVEGLDQAKDVAEEWFLDLRGKTRRGEIVKKEKTFRDAAEGYLAEIRILAISLRSPKYVEYMEQRLRKHLLPYFGDRGLSTINRGVVQAYRTKRAEETIKLTTRFDAEGKITAEGKPPARSTMMQEIVHLRQVLKWAEGMGWIAYVPNLNPPYKTQGKKGRRAWFSPDEYKQFQNALRRRIAEVKRRGWKRHYEEMLDLVLIIANSGLRPDEAHNLELRDVNVEKDAATKQTILVFDVHGKTGTRYAKSMPGAVYPFERLSKRRTEELNATRPEGADPLKLNPKCKVFSKFKRGIFNAVLGEEGLKFDRHGQRRTLYSLRHTYISMRLSEGADHWQIANNCGTSVQMIEEHYAAHIKDKIDVSAINVMRPDAVRRATRDRKLTTNSHPDADASD